MMFMSIHIRNIPNDDILTLAAQPDGLHVQTGSTDISGRPVSGNMNDPLARPWRTAFHARPESLLADLDAASRRCLNLTTRRRDHNYN